MIDTLANLFFFETSFFLFVKPKDPNPQKAINSFSAYDPLLYPLKRLKSLRFYDVLRGYRSRRLVENGLKREDLWIIGG